MATNMLQFLLHADRDIDKDEVNRQNRRAIHYLAVGGISISLANAAAQAVIQGAPLLVQKSFWLFAYYVVLLVLDRWIIPRTYRRSTMLVYVLEAPILLVATLLGTVWDPTHQAITFLMFLIAMPVFILDRPVRVMGVMIGWSAAFLAMVFAFKVPEMHSPDLTHVVEFLLLSLLVSYVVLKLRFEVVHSLERTQYHLEHDVLTTLQNRLCLEARLDDYVGRRLFVAMGDVDHLTLLNDFYGRESGDHILISFAHELKDTFGKKDTYRYGSDEVLCIAVDADDANGVARIDACRDHLRETLGGQFHAPLSYSFGYVTGTPADAQELRNMLQLATIHAHRAKRQGEGKTIGEPYNDQALRAAIVESNVSTHARAYEINQLTGLPTVPYFVTRTEELLNTVIDLDLIPMVGYINIDNFREYNDVFGYAKGDQLIRLVAELLRKALPQRHIAYITGSQFAVMCYRGEVKPAMRLVNAGLLTHDPNHPIHMHAGFAEYFEGASVISLLDKAKLAHQNVDDSKGECYRYYDSALDQEIRFRKYLISHIDNAIDRGWLKVHYQPIVRAQDGVVCNLEALSRWNDPVYGLLPPAQFISTLESERIIYKLSLNVVKQVMRDLRRLSDRNLPLVPVSVNLSRNDFSECDMVEAITKIVDNAGMLHNLLCIEITESAFVEKQELLKREVDRFRSRGFNVWMDDFGSEYSTLNLLQELNFDLIKIDMQFMKNWSPGGPNAVIVAHIIDMCNQLGLTTLVEGVEEPDQHDALYAMGSDKLQGYLFSPPRPISDIINIAEIRHWSLG
ncbi:MAG: EAL domain-containing protein [Coriobacteriales bacterium]|nr:EAL domain-containing protein [Coriobacteriales bacterium]